MGFWFQFTRILVCHKICVKGKLNCSCELFSTAYNSQVVFFFVSIVLNSNLRFCIGERERELLSNCFFYWCPYCVFEMNRSGAKSDKRTAVEVTKDKNRIGQVVLRNPRGASARVRSLNLYFPMYFVFF